MSELNNELNEKELIQDNSLSGDSLEGNESGITTANNEPSVADNNAIDSADEKIDSKTDTEDVSASANDDLQEAKQTMSVLRQMMICRRLSKPIQMLMSQSNLILKPPQLRRQKQCQSL